MLEELHRGFWEGTPETRIQPKAICGFGGKGKTQTALKYAWEYLSDYAHIFWAIAETKEGLLNSFASIAQLLELPEGDAADQNEAAAAARVWMERHDGWLLILDNADELKNVGNFVPSGGDGHVLLTTKSQATGTLATRVELPVMDVGEGALFLLRRSTRIGSLQELEKASKEDQDLAGKIVEELGGLPLALDQAGAYIEEAQISLMEYRALYDQSATALLSRRSKISPDHVSVTVTYNMAIEKVEERSTAAADLIRTCAFLSANDIPEEIFTEGGQHLGDSLAAAVRDTLSFRKVVEEAGRLSLIQREPDSKTLSIHRLVQTVIREEMNDTTRRLWAERVVGAVDQCMPAPDFENWSEWNRLINHASWISQHAIEFGLQTEAAYRVVHETAVFLSKSERYHEAWELFEYYLRSLRHLEPTNKDVVDTQTQLARVEHSLAQYSQAIARLEQIRRRIDSGYAELHPKLILVLSELGVALGKASEYPDALRHQRRELDLLKLKTSDDPNGLEFALNNLGTALKNYGNYEEAVELLHECLDLRRNRLGPRHLRTADTLVSLSSLHRETGRYREAEKLASLALEIREQSLGPEASQLSNPLNALATVDIVSGRSREARDNFRRSMSLLEVKYGKEHPFIAAELVNIANTYLDEGDDDAAEKLLERAFEIQTKTLPEDHLDFAGSLNPLGCVLYRKKRFSEAKEYLEKSLKILDKRILPHHAYRAYCLNNLGVVDIELGAFQKAEASFNESINIGTRIGGELNPQLVETYLNFARLRVTEGKIDDSETLFLRAINLLAESEEPFAQNVERIAVKYLGRLRDSGHHKLAEELENTLNEVIKKRGEGTD